MKTLKNSIIIEDVTVGLHSLRQKDTKFKADGDYHVTALLKKESPEIKAVMAHINEILKKNGSNIKTEMKRQKSPINEEKNDGDKIFKKYEESNTLNNQGEIKGSHLKGLYGIKIRTNYDYKVIDMEKVELDKEKIAWTGAKVNIHCSPVWYSNKFGSGLTILLNNIQVIEEGLRSDSIEDAFGEVTQNETTNIEEKDGELPF